MTKKSSRTNNAQRAIMGVLSLLSLAVGGVLYFGKSTDLDVVCGIFVRVGLLMGVIWLAWPQLIRLPKRIPPLAIGILLVSLFLVASRPRIFPIVAAVMVAAFFLNAVVRRFTGAIKK